MSLASGSRPGPYEILSPLGAGGMWEVYQARDTRLDREVAIKVLPAGLALDLLGLRTGEQRPLRNLGRQIVMKSFDVSPDGKTILFDRYRENSDIVLIDLPPR